MTRDTYSRRLLVDQIEAYPQVHHRTERLHLEKLTLSWSLHDVQYDPGQRRSTWRALYLLTGQRPVRTYTSMSLAQRRIREGDVVGCKVDLRGIAAREWRRDRTVRVLPSRTSFVGRTHKTLDTRGNRTIHRDQPGAHPALLSHVDGLYRRVRASSGKKGSGRKRAITLRGAARSPEATFRYRTALQFPLVVIHGRGLEGLSVRGERWTQPAPARKA